MTRALVCVAMERGMEGGDDEGWETFYWSIVLCLLALLLFFFMKMGWPVGDIGPLDQRDRSHSRRMNHFPSAAAPGSRHEINAI